MWFSSLLKTNNCIMDILHISTIFAVKWKRDTEHYKMETLN